VPHWPGETELGGRVCSSQLINDKLPNFYYPYAALFETSSRKSHSNSSLKAPARNADPLRHSGRLQTCESHAYQKLAPLTASLWAYVPLKGSTGRVKLSSELLGVHITVAIMPLDGTIGEGFSSATT
jgi:hypothetical protein